MQELQFLQNVPFGAKNVRSLMGLNSLAAPTNSTSLSNSSPLQDILDLSPEARNARTEKSSILSKLEAGIDAANKRDADFAKKRMEYMKKEMGLIKSLMSNASTPDQKKALYKHMQGMGKRLENIGAHAEQATGKLEKANPASSTSPLEQSGNSAQLIAYEEKLSVEYREIELKLTTQSVEISDNEIRIASEDIDLTLTQLNITKERTAIIAQNPASDLVKDFDYLVREFTMIAKEAMNELKLLENREDKQQEVAEMLEDLAIQEEGTDISEGSFIAAILKSVRDTLSGSPLQLS